MLWIGLLLIAAIAAATLLDFGNREKVMEEYCRAECKQDVKSKYKFCC